MSRQNIRRVHDKTARDSLPSFFFPVSSDDVRTDLLIEFTVQKQNKLLKIQLQHDHQKTR